MKFSTKAIHVGQLPDETTGAIIPPVYLTSTYVQESPGNTKGYDYTRAGNPNFTNASGMMFTSYIILAGGRSGLLAVPVPPFRPRSGPRVGLPPGRKNPTGSSAG